MLNRVVWQIGDGGFGRSLRNLSYGWMEKVKAKQVF